MLKVKYKSDERKIKIDSYPRLIKFKNALSYIKKCSDVSIKTVYFSCISCGTWIKLLGYKSWPEINELKNPMKREAYYYCRPCLKKAIERYKKMRLDGE